MLTRDLACVAGTVFLSVFTDIVVFRDRCLADQWATCRKGSVSATVLAWFLGRVRYWQCNSSNAEAIFVQSTRMERFLKTIETLSCWLSKDGSC